MLETIEQPNIKHMTVESPEGPQELIFDPEKDLSFDQKQAMGRELEKHASFPAMFTYLQLFQSLKKIDPNLNPDPRMRDFCKTWLATNPITEESTTHTADIKAVFPDLETAPVSENVIKDISAGEHLPPMTAASWLVNMKRLGVTDITNRISPDFQAQLYEALEQRRGLEKKIDVVLFPKLAAKLKYLWPERPIRIDEQQRIKFKKYVNEMNIGGGTINIKLIGDIIDLNPKPNIEIAPIEPPPEQRNF